MFCPNQTEMDVFGLRCWRASVSPYLSRGWGAADFYTKPERFSDFQQDQMRQVHWNLGCPATFAPISEFCIQRWAVIAICKYFAELGFPAGLPDRVHYPTANSDTGNVENSVHSLELFEVLAFNLIQTPRTNLQFYLGAVEIQGVESVVDYIQHLLVFEIQNVLGWNLGIWLWFK